MLFAAPLLLILSPGPHVSAATTTMTDWEMDEPANSSVMADSSGNAHEGLISPLAASEGLTETGAYYSWSQRCSACQPVAAARVVQVPDDPTGALDIPDAAVTYTLTFTFKTHSAAGNYMQKGQSTTKGGQIKVQAPHGIVQCLFKGANGTRVGTGSGSIAPLDDGQWHTVSCIHTATQVQEYVDGVKVASKNGSTGPIDNTSPFTVGGKLNCDQVKVTCDYFVGQIDSVNVTHG